MHASAIQSYNSCNNNSFSCNKETSPQPLANQKIIVLVLNNLCIYCHHYIRISYDFMALNSDPILEMADFSSK